MTFLRPNLHSIFVFALGAGFGVMMSNVFLLQHISRECVPSQNNPTFAMNRTSTVPSTHMFPTSIQNLVTGTSRVRRSAFAEEFDVGMGIDPAKSGNQEILMLYNSDQSLPAGFDQYKDNGKRLPVAKATENCDQVKLVMIDPRPSDTAKPHRHCLAIMGQWESFHVHRFTRDNSTHTFQYSAARHPHPPAAEIVDASLAYLADYLWKRQGFLEQVRPLAQAAANDGGPIIVMVTNWAQSKFLVNLLCVARRRKIDTSRILLFAADVKTYTLAKAMNIHVFYNESLLGGFMYSGQVYRDYQDPKYARSMMLKVYPVDLVSQLGYDLLFMDVDMIWFRDPLQYFLKQAKPGYDIYFQHDGDHHPDKFAPMAANTGVFYSRNNNRTRYFWSSLVKAGDVVLHTHSHQAAVSTLMNEHMNLRGLRAQVLADDSKLFLSGLHLKRHRSLVKAATQGNQSDAILLHVNWLQSQKKEKVLTSLDQWYVDDDCNRFNPENIIDRPGGVLGGCCLAEPAKFIYNKEQKRRAAMSRNSSKISQ